MCVVRCGGSKKCAAAPGLRGSGPPLRGELTRSKWCRISVMFAEHLIGRVTQRPVSLQTRPLFGSENQAEERPNIYEQARLQEGEGASRMKEGPPDPSPVHPLSNGLFRNCSSSSSGCIHLTHRLRRRRPAAPLLLAPHCLQWQHGLWRQQRSSSPLAGASLVAVWETVRPAG